jgi:hypothetical protein
MGGCTRLARRFFAAEMEAELLIISDSEDCDIDAHHTIILYYLRINSIKIKIETT